MATPISSTFINFLFSACLISLFLLCSLEKGYALDRETPQSDHHTVHISSLLPASVCIPSTNGPSKGASLKVVHKHGPCSHLSQDKAKASTPIDQMLSRDQSRVNSIQSQLSFFFNSGRNSTLKDPPQATLPTTKSPGMSSGTGNYMVTIGLGTPKQDLSLIFDTGSDLTWTQCKPCAGSCYVQQGPIFDPSMSKTYRNITCKSSAQCSQLTTSAATGGSGNQPRRCSSTCVYRTEYVDQSFSVGFFGTETLTLTPADVFPNYKFGCGQNNSGPFGGTAGVLGLGRGPLSFVSQTASKYRKYFSYCLPSPLGSTGHLTFGKGKGGGRKALKFTPLSKNTQGQSSSFYFVNITGIKIGGQTLPISQSVFQTAGTIIDSGTVITRLPPEAYNALRTAFRELNKDNPMTRPLSILDTCYDISLYDVVRVPTISFLFGGNVEVPIDDTGILYGEKVTQLCLAFAGNSDASDVGIFGSLQQQTLEVVYDVAGGKLGFATGGCS